jgi:signal transduction histidine kinase
MLTPEVKKNIENITEYYFIKADYYENFIIKSRMLFITYILNLSLVILIIIKYEELIKRKGNRFIIEGIYKSKFGETMYYLKETPKRFLRNINKRIVKFTIFLIIFNIAIEILATSKFFIFIDSVINLFTNRYIDSLIMAHKLMYIINFSSILFYIGYFIFCILRNYIFVYELLDIVREFKNGNMNIKLTYTDKREMNEIVEGIKYIQEEYKIIAEERIKNEQLKTELISNVSHDLKTPLTSIINYVNILDRDDITYEERKQYLKILGTKSQRLQGLIEDLFEMSKFNSGKINLDKYEVDIVQLVHMVIGEQEDKLKEKGLTTRVISYSESVFIQIDPDKMVRVFDNLIVNAIKYSLANTRIYIDIFDDGNWVTISTKNISSYEMNFKPEDMMERFVRGDRSRNSNVEGSGLGLAIARSIVEMHEGDLKLEVEGDMFKTYVMLKK